jgi:hypothetical protein
MTSVKVASGYINVDKIERMYIEHLEHGYTVIIKLPNIGVWGDNTHNSGKYFETKDRAQAYMDSLARSMGGTI